MNQDVYLISYHEDSDEEGVAQFGWYFEYQQEGSTVDPKLPEDHPMRAMANQPIDIVELITQLKLAGLNNIVSQLSHLVRWN